MAGESREDSSNSRRSMSQPQSLFLNRLPLEIRFQIYRHCVPQDRLVLCMDFADSTLRPCADAIGYPTELLHKLSSPRPLRFPDAIVDQPDNVGLYRRTGHWLKSSDCRDWWDSWPPLEDVYQDVNRSQECARMVLDACRRNHKQDRWSAVRPIGMRVDDDDTPQVIEDYDDEDDPWHNNRPFDPRGWGIQNDGCIYDPWGIEGHDDRDDHLRIKDLDYLDDPWGAGGTVQSHAYLDAEETSWHLLDDGKWYFGQFSQPNTAPSTPVQSPSDGSETTSDLGLDFLFGPLDAPLDWGPITLPPALLLTCRQVRDEVEIPLYGGNTFVTMLDWRAGLFNFKAALRPETRTKMRKLVFVLPRCPLDRPPPIPVEWNLSFWYNSIANGGFLDGMLEKVTQLGILPLSRLSPPSSSPASWWESWEDRERILWKIKLKMVLTYLTKGLNPEATVLALLNHDAVAADMIRDVFGPEHDVQFVAMMMAYYMRFH
ncbi:hypothetical protein V8F06_005187 [Rhypophila decipiens]